LDILKSNRNRLGWTFRKGNFSLVDFQKVIYGMIQVIP
jgi:hypothetical protein